MTNSSWILGLRAGSSEAVFWRWDALPKGQAAVLSAPWKHTSPEEGWVLSEARRGYKKATMQRKLFFLHSFPQTLVLQMLGGSICFPVPKLHLIWMLRAFICQWHNSLTEAELLLSVTGMILQLWKKQKTLLKCLFLQEFAELSPCCLHLNWSGWGDLDNPVKSSHLP